MNLIQRVCMMNGDYPRSVMITQDHLEGRGKMAEELYRQTQVKGSLRSSNQISTLENFMSIHIFFNVLQKIHF